MNQDTAGDLLLDVRDLSVDYGSQGEPLPAVSQVSLRLRRGDILGIVGESGSGKTTLVNALLRLLRPPAVVLSGSATLHPRSGAAIDLLHADARELRRTRWEHTAVVFQSAMNALNPVSRLSAQFTDVLRAHRRISKSQARERAAHMLELVGIPAARLDSYPHELSGGTRQRATIALALVCEPDLLVMDEPTTAVDVVMQRQILRQVIRLQRELRFSVVFITHDLSLLLEIADRIAVMYGGRIVESGPAGDLYRDPRHPYTRGLRDSFPPLRGPMRQLNGIPGNPPDLRSLPPGCPFQPRCPHATPDCATAPPALIGHGADRAVACVHAQDLPAPTTGGRV
ncbi:ABC transporter ATP-binding protein [Streptomyces sp. NL15-2K]|uniref:ABC transporter ATP-binding protein n=1 Tax=Streptomyces sp. NL15-2K TaxID=376149 RepID=UPI000F58E6B2|nr:MULTISPECIES: ABC transporter ATP-binding protein [Actinomycetes]WKX07158.1 ABC transporter ATP-binding protein [Kutzneria buriramensis]GCB53179.1 (GlcNAc)2 ABC transporter [Streptomyces sp. NL15-2K]